MTLTILASMSVFADAQNDIAVVIDGYTVEFDVEPTIINGRTMVPLRAIFEALGAGVEWDNVTKTVYASKDGTTVSLQIGSNQMIVNGITKTLDVPAQLVNNRTLVPVRAISEAFGCQVEWNGKTKTVIITQQ